MANVFSPTSTKMSFKLDFGEGIGGRKVYRTISISGLTSDADEQDVADLAIEIVPIFEPAVKLVTLAKSSTMEPQID